MDQDKQVTDFTDIVPDSMYESICFQFVYTVGYPNCASIVICED